MFGTLFLKECKQVLHSMIFYLYLAVFVVFVVSQMGETNIVQAPQPDAEYYGTQKSTEPKDIMEVTLAGMVHEIEWNSFATYPTGFYKQVIVSEDQLEELKQIVETCSGKDWAQLEEEMKAHYAQYDTDDASQSYAADSSYRVSVNEDVKYETFEAEMQKACAIIGRGSSYEPGNYEKSVEVPMTYEDALAEYQAICQDDGITEAYMRLFCDYTGIIMAILPIFIGVTRCVRDKRAKAQQVIYAKAASAPAIICSRYLANVVMMFVPVVIVAFLMQTPYMYQATTLGVALHNLAFLSYCVMWILPMIAFVLALAFLLTELFNGIVAMIVQIFFGIAALMIGGSLVGDFGYNLVPRWNTFGFTTQYLAERMELYQNRILYSILAVAALILTIVVYNYKRKGGGIHVKKH